MEKKFLIEVEKRLKNYRKNLNNSTDVYKAKDNVLWISTNIQRDLLREGYSFSSLPHSQQKKIWQFIFKNSKVFEVRTQALHYYAKFRKDKDFVKKLPELLKMTPLLDNWLHSDMLSDFFARLIESHPKKMIPHLEKWNRSKRFWEQRQSIVSLFYYQSARKVFPKFSLVKKLIIPLLSHDEYYVQKAVGWTLRESIQAYPDQTNTFVEKYLHELSSIAFTTVMEKVPKEKKENYKALRKEVRADKRLKKKLS